jgi:2-polyprenyl-3-methyl-5-hydroxy-6-metoxy-1,4-benzoquinol methylase
MKPRDVVGVPEGYVRVKYGKETVWLPSHIIEEYLDALFEEPRKPRIFIGVPGYHGIQPEVQESFIRMMYRCGKDMPDYDFIFKVVTKKEQFRARNNIVQWAIQAQADWLLMLDDDMVLPPDLVQRLVANDKDVCGALYYQRGGSYHPVLLHRNAREDGSFKPEFYKPYDPIILNPGLYPVDIIGGACMLFKTKVFDRMLPPYFHPELDMGTDIAICNRVHDGGFEIWADTRIQLGHLRDEKEIITSDSIPMGHRQLAAINEVLYNDCMEYLGMTKGEFDFALSQMGLAEERKDKWLEKPRETWEDIKDYYTSYGNWHVLNLTYWALHEHSVFKEWAFDHNNPHIKPGGFYLDFGAGVGHVPFGLAMQKDVTVYPLDVAGAPTLDFIRWRCEKHKNIPGYVGLSSTKEEPPGYDYGQGKPIFDGVFCISVIDHLTDPYGSLEWMTRQTKPGGFLVLDYLHVTNEDNPQHLDRYDVATLDNWMHEHGWRTSIDHPWLFFREGA